MSLHNACCVNDVQITTHVLQALLLSHGHWCGGLNSEQVTTIWEERGPRLQDTVKDLYLTIFLESCQCTVLAQYIHVLHPTDGPYQILATKPQLYVSLSCWILHTELFCMQNVKQPFIKLYPAHCACNCAINACLVCCRLD